MSDKKKSSSDSKKKKDHTDKVKPPKKYDRLSARLERVEAANKDLIRSLESENEGLRDLIQDLEKQKTAEATASPESNQSSGKKCCSGIRDFFNPPTGSMSMVQVAVTAVLAAVVLGLTIFKLVSSFQWRNAINDLLAEPGIEVFEVDRVGFFGKRIIGMRDPLAPEIEPILQKNHIDPAKVELILTDYHSLNTPYAKQRLEGDGESLEKLRDSLLEVVTKFAETSAERHDEDIEKITKMILDARFPKEMETVEIRFQEGIWHLEGGLFDPAYSLFKSEAPAFLVRGTPHWGSLVNLTNAETSELKANIESIDLFQKDQDGNFAHLPRLKRLIRDYDAVCKSSKIPTPKLQIEIRGESMGSFADDIQQIRSSLVADGNISTGRFLPDSIITGTGESVEIKAILKLVSLQLN